MDDFIFKYQIDEKLCDDMIKYFKKNKEYKGEGVYSGGLDKSVKDSIDVTFYNNSTNSTIVKYFKELSRGLNAYCKKYEIPNVRTSMGNNIQYYKPGGGFFTWHCERGNRYFATRALVYMTYLNTVKNGGETEFKYYSKIKPKKGLTLIWPPDFTHSHRGIPAKTEEKYIVTGWVEFQQ